MADRLREYRRKRSFDATPEPAGPADQASSATGDDRSGAGDESSEAGDQARFVVQEHHATRLHWDLRLERDGVLVSWAVPNSIPRDPKQNRKAVHTEDHPLEYLDFAGDIPEGEYGAGQMTVWDTGTYRCEKWRDDEVVVVFEGRQLQGRYALFATGPDAGDWMIHRMDPPADPDWKDVPAGAVLLDAAPGPMPPARRRAQYAVEPWWPGLRVAVRSLPGRLTVLAGGNEDVTAQWPELRAFNRALSSHEALLDAVIVVAGDDGRPSRDHTRDRVEMSSRSGIRRQADARPGSLVLVDVLHLDGRSSTSSDYSARRSLLEDLSIEGDRWRPVTSAGGTDGAMLLQQTARLGLPGVIWKPLRSGYGAGAGWIATSSEGHDNDG